MAWADFVNKRSLIAQLATLAGRGVPPGHSRRVERFADDSPTLIADPDLIDKAMEWIRLAFEHRLANRVAVAALSNSGSHVDMCDRIAARFDLLHRWQEFENPPEVDRSQATRLRSPEGDRIREWATKRSQHELYPLLDWFGWNGWERKALGFLDVVDRARAYDPATPHDPADFSSVFEYRRAEKYVEARKNERQTSAISSAATPSIKGYHAPEYALALADTFAKDPEGYLLRSSFRVLRDDADLSERQERTVKEAIGYSNGEGFAAFINQLHVRLGRTLPNSRQTEETAEHSQ